LVSETTVAVSAAGLISSLAQAVKVNKTPQTVVSRDKGVFRAMLK
jgi:hypothetical protein